MSIFLITGGSLFIALGLFMLVSYMRILTKGKCVIGEICGIDFRGNYGARAAPYFIEVQFKEEGQDIKLLTVHNFCLVPFFEKYRLSKLRKKHIGRQVHIYYIPAKKRQVLLREYVWKEFLISAFVFSIGAVLIFACICK